jgi:hypothetical protein
MGAGVWWKCKEALLIMKVRSTFHHGFVLVIGQDRGQGRRTTTCITLLFLCLASTFHGNLTINIVKK